MMREDTHIFTGMRKDVHPIKQDAQMLWDCLNMRLTSRNETINNENIDSNTMLSLTNESSTSNLLNINSLLESNVEGDVSNVEYIGHAILNDYIILFVNFDTYSSRIKKGGIIRIDTREDNDAIILYESQSLRFESDYPIQALSIYETPFIQKVYWVDGNHQPRVINIRKPELMGDKSQHIHKNYTKTYSNTHEDTRMPFDFVQELDLNETVKIDRVFDVVGRFHSGVIQYAFTYYNKYGQESNIFYTSPLLYISYNDRGAKEDDIVNCAFSINISECDTKFDYVRIYSIFRSTKDSIPTVKIVQDISVSKNVSYIDTGTTGDLIDSQSLLFLGGQSIVAGCIHSTENTLFLGDIQYNNTVIDDDYINTLQKKFKTLTDKTKPTIIEHPTFNNYYKGITSYSNSASFKCGDVYRLGIQLQYKDGSWSQPIPWGGYNKEGEAPDCDFKVTKRSIVEKVRIGDSHFFNLVSEKVYIEGELDFIDNNNKHDFKRVRPLIAVPSWNDRNILAQGFLCPTVYQKNNRSNNSPYAQSSWFIRPFNTGLAGDSNNRLYCEKNLNAEIQNMVEKDDSDNDSDKNAYYIDQSIVTFHSPDIEFNEELQNIINYNDSLKLNIIGKAVFNVNYGAIDITLSSVTADSSGGSDNTKGNTSITAGYYFKDAEIDDAGDAKSSTSAGHLTALNPWSFRSWLIYPWHRSGSLNNDIPRPAGLGQRTSILQKKVLANLRYSMSSFESLEVKGDIFQIFNSDDVSVLKLHDNIYYGNVDTVNPSYKEYDIYVDNGIALSSTHKKDNKCLIGDVNKRLIMLEDPIRIKYKSTPHVVIKLEQALSVPEESTDKFVYIAELVQSVSNPYGGKTKKAIQDNIWIPAGPPVTINYSNGSHNTVIQWTTGDTWCQRYDCLKTYPFTQEDENQIVEIGSVVLETRFNLEGRYDRNRGLVDNTKVSPLNFNLMNPVYSQLDNFFNYRIMDEDYSSNHYPNQIVWSLPKANGAMKDSWTSINLANTLNLDGSQGKVVNIASYNSILLAFQESAVQQLIFNPRIQIQASDGIPIEIANSQKMHGTRILSDTIGCQDKFSMTLSPYGLYFIDNNNNSVYLFDGKINDLGANLGQLYWFRENYSNTTWKYKTTESGNNSIRLAYDPKYKDVYFTPGINADETTRNTLCYSELLGKFSGLFTYDNAVLIPTDNKLFSIYDGENGDLCLYEHTWGKGGTKIFGKKRDYSFSFISNPNSTINKTFDTIELRANLYNTRDVGGAEDFTGDTLEGTDVTHTKQSGQPFTHIRVDTEAQDTGEIPFSSDTLRKKFNIWRGIIPRDAKSPNGRARIKNPWARIKLINKADNDSDLPYTILHDITVKYSI